MQGFSASEPVQSEAVSLPVISSSQNGPGVAHAFIAFSVDPAVFKRAGNRF